MGDIISFIADLTKYLSDKDILAIVVLLSLGFFLRKAPRVKNDLIPCLVFVAGILTGCLLLTALPYPERIGRGIVYAAFTSLIYEAFIKHLLDWLATKSAFFAAPTNKNTTE